MGRRHLFVLAMVVALVGVGASFRPFPGVAAPMDSTGYFQSEGCDVFGDTAYWSGGGLQAFTVAIAFDDSFCNWVYLQGQYYAYPTWYFGVGPWWSYEPSDGEYTYLAPGANNGNFWHSACDAGGPCSNAVTRRSDYP